MLLGTWFIHFFASRSFPTPAFLIRAFERWLWRDPRRIKEFLVRVDPEALWRIAQKKLLPFVRRAFESTPALCEIKNRAFPGKRIRSVKEFREFVPVLDKDSYRKKFPLKDLCRNGVLPRAGSFYKSAGTSGRPTLWVESIEEEIAFDAAVAFIGNVLLDIPRREYTIVNCWALSSWPTGINFAASARFQGKVINAGTNLEEALDIVTLAGPGNYLLAGYPPFLFHFFEEAEKAGILGEGYRFDVVAGGEGFTEEWRDHLIRKLGRDRVIFSAYGSTDKGLGEGVETNLSYIVRSLMYIASVTLSDEARAREIQELRFGPGEAIFTKENAKAFLLDLLKREENILRNPMVFQFDPTRYYNENITIEDPATQREIDEFLTTVVMPELWIPRVRYNIHDEGFVATYTDVVNVLKKYDMRIDDFNPRNDEYLDLHLPFLFLYGRSDGTISLDGSNIFPNDVASALYANEELRKKTRSFQLFVAKNYHLGVAVELRSGEHPSDELKEKYERQLKKALEHSSFGYRELLYDRLPSAGITVELWGEGRGPFSQNGLKFRYVRK